MTLRRRVTLSDVAAKAGVSPTSASYVLNGHSNQMRISPQTETRVRRAAVELGYRPNRSARSLRTGTTKTIGLISDFVASGHFASQMLSGASAAAGDNGHLLLIGETEGERGIEDLLVEEIVDRQVDGIVYATRTTAQVRLPDTLRKQRAVLLNCVDPEIAHPAVLPDEYEGGRTAARLLVESGVRDGIHLVGEDPTPGALAGRLRADGVRAALAEAGLTLAGLVGCHWDVVPAHDAVSDWLQSGARPSGLICLNDRIAMGAYEALAARGLRVPEDVAVVSFDGSELATWLRPSLTSVAVPYAEMGALAVRLLLARNALEGAAVHHVPMPVLAGRSLPQALDQPPDRSLQIGRRRVGTHGLGW